MTEKQATDLIVQAIRDMGMRCYVIRSRCSESRYITLSGGPNPSSGGQIRVSDHLPGGYGGIVPTWGSPTGGYAASMWREAIEAAARIGGQRIPHPADNYVEILPLAIPAWVHDA
jgi:hypothetical protein